MLSVSVIIPINSHKEDWLKLIHQISDHPRITEIIISSPSNIPADFSNIQSKINKTLLWVNTKKLGRAVQMNEGAKVASGSHLWFLHADTLLSSNNVDSFLKFVEFHLQALSYLDLKFDTDSFFLKLNAFGAKLRSHFFDLPFGDQGICLSREIFLNLGGYNEFLEFGEDLQFLVKCKKRKIDICSSRAKITTSARKYLKNGWLKTTAVHVFWTFKLNRQFRQKQTAIAIFVKTPGLTPLKTRLGKTKGAPFAEKFYSLAVLSLKRTFINIKQKNDQVTLFWAISESPDKITHQWPDFINIFQDEGDLGVRIDSIFSSLSKNYDNVIITGSDSPHVVETDYLNAIQLLADNDVVVGPCFDGGFYLFGSRHAIKKETWLAVPYSENNTLEVLLQKLEPGYKIARLRTTFDVDGESDLIELEKDLNQQKYMSKEKQNLLAFLRA